MKQTSYRHSDEILKMIEAIKAKLGFTTRKQVIEQAVRNLHDKTTV